MTECSSLSVALCALVAVIAGCDHPYYTGNVALDVTVASDAKFNDVDYVITGIGIVAIKGSLRTAQPATVFTGFLSHIPAGKDYALTVVAKSIDLQESCTGSTVLDVKANATTFVGMTLGCENVNDGHISIHVGVECPAFQVTTYTVSPLAISIGGTIDVSAATSEPSETGVSFMWTSSAGTFAEPTHAQTTFACTAAGMSTLTVQAMLGACSDARMVTVSCVSADAGAD